MQALAFMKIPKQNRKLDTAWKGGVGTCSRAGRMLQLQPARAQHTFSMLRCPARCSSVIQNTSSFNARSSTHALIWAPPCSVRNNWRIEVASASRSGTHSIYMFYQIAAPSMDLQQQSQRLSKVVFETTRIQDKSTFLIPTPR
jgi:hypothetical protein